MTTTRTRPAVTVADVMTDGVVSAHRRTHLKTIMDAMTRNRVSTVPVLDSRRRVVGVVTAADLLTRMSADRGRAPRGHRVLSPREEHAKETGRRAAEVMTRPAITIGPDATLHAAARTMAHARVRCLPVVDAVGTLLGMVTKSDLLRWYERPDNDIRTEIEDDVIAGAMVLEPFTVEVTVVDGVVGLSGWIPKHNLHDQLLTLVRSVPGVLDVDDALRLPPAVPR